MGIVHAAVCVDGVAALECSGTFHQCFNQSVQCIVVGIISIDVGTQHRSISQHGGLVHGDAHNRQLMDIPGNLTAALGQAKGRMTVGNIQQRDDQIVFSCKVSNGMLAGKIQIQAGFLTGSDHLLNLLQGADVDVSIKTQILSSLSEDGKRIFQEYQELRERMAYISEEDMFVNGFRIGVGLLLDAVGPYDSQFVRYHEE